jgi:hypothetical protein
MIVAVTGCPILPRTQIEAQPYSIPLKPFGPSRPGYSDMPGSGKVTRGVLLALLTIASTDRTIDVVRRGLSFLAAAITTEIEGVDRIELVSEGGYRLDASGLVRGCGR